MKFKHLLSLALATGFSLCSSFATEQYLIKDGKLVDGIEILKYGLGEDGKPAGDSLIDASTAPDGTTAVEIQHYSTYNGVRFYTPAGIDLNKTWNVEVEFYYTPTSIDTAVLFGSKYAGIDMALIDDTTGDKYGWASGFAQIPFDVKAENTPDVWNTKSDYIYGNPNVTLAKCFVFCWGRQTALQGENNRVWIKNLKFVGEGNKPFFAENYDYACENYNDGLSKYENYLVKVDGTLSAAVNGELGLTGGAMPIALFANADTVRGTVMKASKFHIATQRLWEDRGTDGSDYDCDLMQGLCFLSHNTTSLAANQVSGFYLIPTEGLSNVKSFNVDFKYKWYAPAKDGLTATTSEDSTLLPVGIMFVDSIQEIAPKINSIGYATAGSAAFTPDASFLTDATGATLHIPGSWASASVKPITMNATKKYIALYFGNALFAYQIDNLRLTAIGEGDGLSMTGVTTSTDAYVAGGLNGVVSYTMAATGGDVETVLSQSLSIYPNPANDVVTVTNEGVTNITVISLSGAAVAQASGNKINVSNLAKGVYIVKAYSAKGVITGTIIKK